MALNFPVDTSAPYVDPTSGLKYVYNNAVGAWEPAIQPPVIYSAAPTPPDIQIEGFLWFDGTNLYVYHNSAWTLAGGAGSGASVTVGDAAPATPGGGDLWWDSANGRLFVYYIDIDSSQWVDASPNISGSNGSNVFSGPNAPSNAVEGALWFNTTTNQLYVYTSDTWVETQNSVSGVTEVTGTLPITITGTTADPVVGVSQASTSATGVVRLATQAETDAATEGNVVLTPGGLAAGIDNYLPQASEVTRGAIELATTAEVQVGTNTTKAVTPDTLSSSLAALGLAIPSGSVTAFAGATAPAGYLICDGSQVSRTTYADLYAVIADTYGAGDGSTTFNLPDLRGEFIRGLDGGRGADAGRVLGSFQADEFASHTHTGVSGDAGTDPARIGGGNRDVDTGTYTTNAAGGTETRPRNVAMNYIIKT
jgi:microcystin-dependent protein